MTGKGWRAASIRIRCRSSVSSAGFREEHDVKAGMRIDAIEEIVISAELHVASGLADRDARR